MTDEPRAVSELTERLARWVEQQPEYPFLFLADRARRRRAARIVAYRLFVLPAVPSQSPGRANIRASQRAAKKRMGQFMGKLSARRQRELHKAKMGQRRFRRLSMQRTIDLAFRENGGDDGDD